MRIINIILYLLVIAFAQSSVQAEWYVGASTNTNSILPAPSSLSDQTLQIDSVNRYEIEQNTSNFSLFGGFKASQNFSLQLEYQDELSFGVDDLFSGASLWVPESSGELLDTNGFYFSGIQSYPINNNGVFYMKGGLFSWQVDTDYYQASEYYLGQNHGTDVFYGLGASYDLNTRFGISAEWERYQLEESDVDFLSTKFRFKF